MHARNGQGQVEISFTSTLPGSVEDDDMRSERLTRKSRFRKLNLLQDSGGAGSDVQEDAHGRAVWSLGTLRTGATNSLPEELTGFSCERDALLWCVQVMNESPTARILYELAETQGWSVCLDDLKNEGFYIDSNEHLIVLDHFALAPAALGRSAFFRHIMLTTFIRALRDVWHEDRFASTAPDYAPDHLLMLERVRAADCDTVTILCGWELRCAGFTDVWRHLLGSEEGDMAIVFSRFLERDPGALFNGAALAYAFRQWYADTARVDGVDHDTLEWLDDLLETMEQPVSFGQRRLDEAALEDLATLPDGTRYLQGLGGGILRDPFFAGLNDPINQTHLFHLVYDTQVIMVNNVPFRDASLARMIFPQVEATRVRL
jgi:hypothetical protein